VFKVKLLNSADVVWRRRHYRVRRADAAGTFYFSVSSACRHSAAAELVLPDWQSAETMGDKQASKPACPPFNGSFAGPGFNFYGLGLSAPMILLSGGATIVARSGHRQGVCFHEQDSEDGCSSSFAVGYQDWQHAQRGISKFQIQNTLPYACVFQVLDNGVTSNEYWRIVDCTDDLSWALFYYAGAASAAGQAYSGAVLVTPDGAWPSKDQEERLCAALDAAGIKLWELYRVDNHCCEGAPLEISPKELPPKGISSTLFSDGPSKAT
jgi:hypothetical protein